MSITLFDCASGVQLAARLHPAGRERRGARHRAGRPATRLVSSYDAFRAVNCCTAAGAAAGEIAWC